MTDAFISYQSQDVAIAETVHEHLLEAGFSVWFDKARLDPGCDWYRDIAAGCESSRVVLTILTPRWASSQWTKFETYGAEHVLPLLFEGTFAKVAPAPLLRFQVQAIGMRDSSDPRDADLSATDLHRIPDATKPRG
jgi:TIR domain